MSSVGIYASLEAKVDKGSEMRLISDYDGGVYIAAYKKHNNGLGLKPDVMLHFSHSQADKLAKLLLALATKRIPCSVDLDPPVSEVKMRSENGEV